MSFKRNLPSVKALATFEAAMRLKSFTLAARELNVTQAAVSRQVRALEEDFGVPLFSRGHRKVEATSAGARLGLALTQSFDAIAETVESLRQRPGARNVTVATTLAFSYFWLLPRLPRFRALHPDLTIRVVSQDEVADLRNGNLDVVIRYGHAPFSDGRVLTSRTDAFFPVCSPGFAAGLGPEVSAAALLSAPLIAHEAADPSWMSWPDWFEQAGVGRRSPPPALRVNHYADAIAAAVAGQGVALGWAVILHDLIACRQLAAVGEKVQAGPAYNVVVPFRRAHAAAETFAAWVAETLREPADA